MPLTRPEENLIAWFREFQKTGGNQLTLARKDIAVLVSALDRLGQEVPAEKVTNGFPVSAFKESALPVSNVVNYRPKLCVDCRVEFGPTVAPVAMVVGKGPVCEFCANRRGIR